MSSTVLTGPRSGALTQGALGHWLRLLFGRAPTLCFDSDAPFIADGAIHLPEQAQARAAAADAAAHLVYSPPRFDGTGLGPVARALVGLLEDARVEALAIRELPGLARLWRPLHVATPALGTGLDALLQRLARALADPAYDDPDTWLRKGRALFFIDADIGIAALRTPAEVCRAATLLGHDIGQMLQTAADAAEATRRALRVLGIDCAVAAFASHGRHDVRVDVVKHFGERADDSVGARLVALGAAGSTRLGAALRHAVEQLGRRPSGPRWLLVFSDGEPHDVDMHDPRYLVEDARHAVRAAARRSVRMVCIALGNPTGADAARIFGAAGVRPLRCQGDLGRVFRQLLGRG